MGARPSVCVDTEYENALAIARVMLNVSPGRSSLITVRVSFSCGSAVRIVGTRWAQEPRAMCVMLSYTSTGQLASAEAIPFASLELLGSDQIKFGRMVDPGISTTTTLGDPAAYATVLRYINEMRMAGEWCQ